MTQVPLPTATDSREEEMPEPDEDGMEDSAETPPLVSRPTFGSQLKQKSPVQPPGAPKKTKVTTMVKPTWQSQHIAQQTSRRSTGSSTPTSSTA
jgi:hypothetical protein